MKYRFTWFPVDQPKEANTFNNLKDVYTHAFYGGYAIPNEVKAMIALLTPGETYENAYIRIECKGDKEND